MKSAKGINLLWPCYPTRRKMKMSIPAGRVIRTRKELEKIALEFMEDLETVWGNDAETIRRLDDMDKALADMQCTMNILQKTVDRLDYLRVKERRKGFKIVKCG